MNFKTLITRGVMATVMYFLLGWLVFANLFADYFNSHMGPGTCANRPQDQILIWSMFVSCLGYGFLLSFVFSRSGIHSFRQGLITGAVTGFLYACAVNFNLYATTTTWTMEGIIADIIIFTIISAIIGAAVSFIGRRGKTSAAVIA